MPMSSNVFSSWNWDGARPKPPSSTVGKFRVVNHRKFVLPSSYRANPEAMTSLMQQDISGMCGMILKGVGDKEAGGLTVCKK